jgi:SecD/SecF fusion protein
LKGKYGKLATILVPLVVAIVVLYPSFEASKLEEKKNTAYFEAAQKHNSDDSLTVIENFNRTFGEDLESAKQNRLKLGLDLRGGMYVTLEVDVVRLIEESASRDAIDETFGKVIEATKAELIESDEPALDVFLSKFESIARPEGKSLISYFDVGDIRNASEEKIIEQLKDNALSAIDQAQEVIRQRIDKYGVAEPNIQKQGTRRILLELPGVTNEEEMRKLLSTTARLEFNLLREDERIVKAFQKIDEYLVSKNERETALTGPEEIQEEVEVATLSEESSSVSGDGSSSLSSSSISDNPYEGLSQEDAVSLYRSKHPFTSLFYTYFSAGEGYGSQLYDYTQSPPPGVYTFQIMSDSVPRFEEILSRSAIKPLIPSDLKIALSAKGDERVGDGNKFTFFTLYVLKAEPELIGDVITGARKNIDPTTNSWVVNMSMNADGSERWARITGANIKKRIAIMLDDHVYSAPTVQSKISGGSSQISGMANSEEANLLEIILKAGALKAPVSIIEERLVGASLGEDSIKSGLNSALIAFGLVIIFMFLYYSKGGVVSNIALFINISLIMTVLTALHGTLTLPGIAGIILTMGMAVDANILIFERIREELDKGRSLRSAIDEGFAKAMSAIIDSNITSFIVGLILFYFGTGLIQGFALTLMVGILSTLFTAILITRALIELMMGEGSSPSFSFGQPALDNK